LYVPKLGQEREDKTDIGFGVLQNRAQNGTIPTVPVRMADCRVAPMKNRFTTSQTGQMGIQ